MARNEDFGVKVVILFIVLFGMFFVLYYFNSDFTVRDRNTYIDTFVVNYYYNSVSSGGKDMTWNISYSVIDGEIVSCDGVFYKLNRSLDEPFVEYCDVNKLRNQESPFKIEKFITRHNVKDDLSGDYRYGGSYYSWEIILE